MLKPGRSAEARDRSGTLPLEADSGVSVGRVFLGSTLEFMQREYFMSGDKTEEKGKASEP